MQDIGKNIRALRMRKKLSQDQLAEAIHVTRQTVSNYETGRSRPDVEMLTELAQALDVDIKELVYGPIGREPLRPAPAASGGGSSSDRPCCHSLFCRRCPGAAAAAGAIPGVPGIHGDLFRKAPVFYSAELDTVSGMSDTAAVRAPP